jgi:hypothetical protein
MEDADLAELSAHYARDEERELDLVGVEGPAFLVADLAERLADPAARAVVLDTARAVERVPELLGISPHLLATGIRPA